MNPETPAYEVRPQLDAIPLPCRWVLKKSNEGGVETLVICNFFVAEVSFDGPADMQRTRIRDKIPVIVSVFIRNKF
jgi:hypothetical protein